MPTILPAPYRFENGYIMLPLAATLFTALPVSIEHDGKYLHKKTSFHVSLVSVDEIILTVGATADIRHKDIEEQLLSSFKLFVEKTPLMVARFTDDVRYAVERDQQAILVRCVVPHIEEFVASLNKVYGTTMPVQPTHVTLYKLLPDNGIGITSEKKMEGLPRVDIPSINRVIDSITEIPFEKPSGA